MERGYPDFTACLSSRYKTSSFRYGYTPIIFYCFQVFRISGYFIHPGNSKYFRNCSIGMHISQHVLIFQQCMKKRSAQKLLHQYLVFFFSCYFIQPAPFFEYSPSFRFHNDIHSVCWYIFYPTIKPVCKMSYYFQRFTVTRIHVHISKTHYDFMEIIKRYTKVPPLFCPSQLLFRNCPNPFPSVSLLAPLQFIQHIFCPAQQFTITI